MHISLRSVQLWRTRRELAALVWQRNELLLQAILPRQAQEEEDLPTKCMQLLRQHPELASETFPCRDTQYGSCIYPFFFLLLVGANLECLREAHGMYFHAAGRQVGGNFGQRGYPLHIACGLTSEEAPDEIIIFLVEAYLPAVYYSDSLGCLPIHVFLRNRRRAHTTGVVETLLDLYREYASRGNQCMDMFMDPLLLDSPSTMDILASDSNDSEEMINSLREPLALAIKNPHISKDILELLVRKFPKDAKVLRLGRIAKHSAGGSLGYTLGQETNYTMTLDHVCAMSKLLPRLETMCCPARAWEALAFNKLMSNLCSNESSITDLTIRFPDCPNTAKAKGKLSLCSDSLRQLLIDNATLRQLHIIFPGVLVQGKSNILSCLVEGLRNNQGIKRLWLTGGRPLFHHYPRKESPFWPALSCLLQEQNVVLQDVFVDGKQPRVGEVIYLTTLNRLGRARVRSESFTIHDMVLLLDSIRGTTSRLDVIFGLLSENPSLWSNNGSALQAN